MFADRAVFDKFMEREKYKYIKDLLESDTRFQTIHSDFSENSIVTTALKKYGTDQFESWEKFDELVLAKDLKGRNIYSVDQLVEGQMQMNPLLERFFLVDLLFRTSIRHLTVGTELGHANGYGQVIRDPETGEIDVEKTMEMEMSARNVSSLKRAVGETLPRSMITAGSVVTLPTVLHVAVMPDVKGHVFNISGESKDIDAHDGSSFLNPLTAILINLGLAGNEGGEDLKGLLRAMNDRFGQAILFKYASFSQYNERMRNSLSGNINMLHIFKK